MGGQQGGLEPPYRPNAQFLPLQTHLDLPNIGLAAHAKLEILLGNRVPVLVHHHDRQQRKDGDEENAVNVVLGTLANRRRQNVLENDADDEEKETKEDVSQWPAVFEGVEHEDDLEKHVNDDARRVENEPHGKERHGLECRQAGNVEESSNGDEVDNSKDDKGRQADRLQKSERCEQGLWLKFEASTTYPKRKRRAVLCPLESDKAVKKQAPETC